MTSTKSNNQNTISRPEWLTHGAWPYDIRTANVAGSTVAYTDEGTGPTLLFVHDGMNSYLWLYLIGLLGDRYRVITLDFPGSGLSPADDRAVSLEGDSRLLEEFVDFLGLEALTLVVHDLGGGVGLGFATRRPSAITGLVLVNTFAWPPDTAPLRGMLKLMGSRPIASLNSGINFLARASSGRLGVGRHFDEEQRGAYVHMFDGKGARRRFHALMKSAAGESDYLARVESGLSDLADTPALTVFGEHNDPFGFQERWLTYFPDADQLVIPGGYHFPMCDQPEAVAQGIRHLERDI